MDLSLNHNQKQAVTCPLKPTIVIAGPGSGKTHVIINRIHYMITELNCAPSHILVVTFSKLAAQEMKERFITTYGQTPVNFGTLHSIFYRILRAADPVRYHINNLLLEDEKKKIIQNLFMELEVDEYEDFIEEFLKHLTLMKNQLIAPKHYYPDGLSRELFLKLYKAYDSYKERHLKFDFDDMLVDCYNSLIHNENLLHAVQKRYAYILIDEFQDINLAQFEIIKLLGGKKQNIFVVGDDDQSIYKFRGAKPEFLLDFKKYFPSAEQIFLETNYRCSKNIVSYTTALINHNKARYAKALTTPNEAGPMPELIHCKDAKEQASLILKQIISLKNEGQVLKDMAVIYRTNLSARPIVEHLLTSNIAFSLRDGMMTLYDQWVTKDIIAYLKLAQNHQQTELAVNLINKPKRYISKAATNEAVHKEGDFLINLLSLDALTEWQKNYIQQFLFDLQNLKEKTLSEAIAYIRKKIGYDNYVIEYAEYRKVPHSTLLEVLDEIQDSAESFKKVEEWETFLKDVSQKVKQSTAHKNNLQDSLTLTTMHGSKGLEFNNVFIIDVVEGMIPHHKSSHEIEEERRLLYVAMTRAKDHLYLYIPSEKYGKSVGVSPFISELLKEVFKNQAKYHKYVVHKVLGKGEVLKVLDDNILMVKFKNDKIRKIDGNYCLGNAIIKWED